jgi:hypothetical protein
MAWRRRATSTRLDQIVRRVDLERLDRMLGMRGDEHHRRLTLQLPERLGELHPREPRHVDVEEHDVV